jgi:hypothetical protein
VEQASRPINEHSRHDGAERFRVLFKLPAAIKQRSNNNHPQAHPTPRRLSCFPHSFIVAAPARASQFELLGWVRLLFTLSSDTERRDIARCRVPSPAEDALCSTHSLNLMPASSEMVTMDEPRNEESETEVIVDDGRKRSSPLSHVEDENSSIKRRRRNKTCDETFDANKENEGQGFHGRRTASFRSSPETTPAGRAPSFNNALSAQRNVNVAGKPPEAGIILKIYVENFMCHRKLTVDLCRNVNFIYGNNGR